MNILHLNSYFLDNKLYEYLYKSLSKYHTQIVYAPIKYNRESRNLDLKIENFDIKFSKIIKKYHKVLYFNKLKVLLYDLLNKISFDNIDFIHAHNLFIDGVLAYEIKKRYNIDYIVNLRLTDIELQYKYMYHRRGPVHKALLNAKNIVFVSEISKEKFFKILNKNVSKNINNKTLIIPNGILKFWHDNKYFKNDNLKTPIKLLFVGRIIKLKNIENIIKALNILNHSRRYKFILTIIGGMHAGEELYFKKLQKLFNNSNINYKGEINSLSTLKTEYRNHDIFVMPSTKELFGIAYLEALSQSLPVIYSKNQGIDKMFEEGQIGYGCDPNRPNDIADKIIKIKDNYDSIVPNCANAIDSFDWNLVANKYINLYKL
jgi:glycosyltransferase involved in cell wall biosynthesis